MFVGSSSKSKSGFMNNALAKATLLSYSQLYLQGKCLPHPPTTGKFSKINHIYLIIFLPSFHLVGLFWWSGLNPSPNKIVDARAGALSSCADAISEYNWSSLAKLSAFCFSVRSGSAICSWIFLSSSSNFSRLVSDLSTLSMTGVSSPNLIS